MTRSTYNWLVCVSLAALLVGVAFFFGGADKPSSVLESLGGLLAVVGGCSLRFLSEVEPRRAAPRTRLPDSLAETRRRVRDTTTSKFVVINRKVSLRQQRCPYCHDDLPQAGVRLACPECRAVYHGECVHEGGGCATLGCRHARRSRRYA